MPATRVNPWRGTGGSPLRAGAIVAVAVLAYVVPLLEAGWIWDDNNWVVGNRTLRSLGGLSAIWLAPSAVPQYYPMVHSVFWIEYKLFGLQPAGYHLVNLAIHAANAVLLFLILRRLAVPGAWLSGAVFAVHPVNVESVAWVTELKNVLSAAFYFSAALCFLRFLGLETPGPAADAPQADGRSRRAYVSGAVLFLCALLSKTVTASFPAAVLLVTWWKKKRLARGDLIPLVPLVPAGVALGLMTAWMEKHQVGATGTAWNLSPAQRVLVAGRAVWFYAGKIVFPVRLAFNYPRWRIDAGDPLQYAFPAGAVAAVVALWVLRRRIGAGPLVGVLFFAGTLLPALGFFSVYPMRYSFVADHFQYLASVGLIAVLSAAAASAAASAGQRVRLAAPALAAVVLALLAGLTWDQARVYRDAETLWRDTLAKNPSSWLAKTDLGEILVGQGKTEEGVALYREAIRLEPALVEPRLNLAAIFLDRGELEEGIRLIEEAERIQPDNPFVRYELGIAYLKATRYPEAISELSRVLALAPGYPGAEYDLGTALLKLNRDDEAAAHLGAAVGAQPEDYRARLNFSLALARLGRSAEAEAQRADGMRLKARQAGSQGSANDASR